MTLHEEALIIIGQHRKNVSALIDILTRIDQAKAYLELGASSLFSYCVKKLKLTESETYRYTQVTRKTYEVPQLRAAISQGFLSVSQASRIAPVIKSENFHHWIQKAQDLKQRELEREVKKERPELRISPRLTVLNAHQSKLTLVIESTLEKKLLRVQEVYRTKSLTETLELMADLALKHKDPLEKAKRMVDRKAASRQVEEFQQGKIIPEHSKLSQKMDRSQPMNQDLRVIPGLQPIEVVSRTLSTALSMAPQRKLPLRLPRRQPLSADLKHQVSLRDKRECTYRNCGERKWTEVHHLQPVAQGGANVLANLVTLCSAHHRFLHENQSSRGPR